MHAVAVEVTLAGVKLVAAGWLAQGIAAAEMRWDGAVIASTGNVAIETGKAHHDNRYLDPSTSFLISRPGV